MDANLKTSVWRQFGATIEYLARTIEACPDSLWTFSMWDTGSAPPERSRTWYVAYHTLFWLDLYLTGAEEGFTPPEPFDLVEMEPNETLPRTYTRDELLGYLAYCRERCRARSMAYLYG